jgi:hypothetical protein
MSGNRPESAAAAIASALADPARPAPPSIASDDLIAAALQHRVLLLLGWTLRQRKTLDQWPAGFVAAFARVEAHAVVVDAVREAELARLLTAFSMAGVRTLLLKGAALAYSHYAAPHLRVRTDTDLLVELDSLPALTRVARQLGYTAEVETSGRLVSYQCHFAKIDRHGVRHALDVHWKVSNVQALADALTFRDLWAQRVSVPPPGPPTATVDPARALLLALVHHAGHHPGSDDLLWLYDVHLLASELDARSKSELLALCRDRGLSQLASGGLSIVRGRFGTPSADALVTALRDQAKHEPPRAVIEPTRWRQVDILRCDLAALPGWRDRGRLLREHLLPPAAYVRDRYGVRATAALPALYVWRVVTGVPRWLTRAPPRREKSRP